MTDNSSVATLNPQDRQKLKMKLAEMTNSLLRIDSEKELMKEIANDIKEEFEIKPALTNRLARTMFKHNYEDVVSEHEHFEFLYESLVNGKTA